MRQNALRQQVGEETRLRLSLPRSSPRRCWGGRGSLPAPMRRPSIPWKPSNAPGGCRLKAQGGSKPPLTNERGYLKVFKDGKNSIPWAPPGQKRCRHFCIDAGRLLSDHLKA